MDDVTTQLLPQESRSIMILIYDNGTTYYIPAELIYQPFGRREAESELEA